MPGFLSPGKGVPLLLIPEYSEINKGQRVPDRSKTAHRKPLVKCFLTLAQEHEKPRKGVSQRRISQEGYKLANAKDNRFVSLAGPSSNQSY